MLYRVACKRHSVVRYNFTLTMKKVILLSLLIVVIVAVGVQSLFSSHHYFHDKNTAVAPNKSTHTNDTSSSSDIEQVLTSPNDTGFLASTPDGNSHVYTNNNLGIQMIVPKHWVLGQITNKNVLFFNDPVDALTYYQSHKEEFREQTPEEIQNWINNRKFLSVRFFTDVNAWLNDPGTYELNCMSVKQCFENNGDYQVSDIRIDGYQGIDALSIGGDVISDNVYIEHNGLFEFTTPI